MAGSEPSARDEGIRLADEVRALLVDLHALDPSAAALGKAVDRVAAARDSLGDAARLRWH